MITKRTSQPLARVWKDQLILAGLNPPQREPWEDEVMYANSLLEYAEAMGFQLSTA